MNISSRDLSTFNATRAPILFWDQQEICRYANPAFFEWFGNTPDDIIGRLDLKSFLGDSNYQTHHGIIEKSLQGAKQSIELALPISHGTLKEVLLTLIPYTANDLVIGFFLHLTDFTELRMAAKKEPISEKITEGIFASFIAHSPVPAWIVDAAGIVHYLNEAFLKVKPQVRIGHSYMKSFPSEVAEAYQRVNREILALRKAFFSTEKIFDGLLGERIFKIIKFPILFNKEYMVGGFAIDITEQLSDSGY